MTIESPNTLNTTRFQVGQADGQIDPVDVEVLAESAAGLVNSSVTASFTFALTQRGTVVNCNHATVAINATIPPNSSVAFDVGVILGICKRGAAAVAFVAGAGVTFVTPHTLICSAVGSEMYARKDATDTWIIGGDST